MFSMILKDNTENLESIDDTFDRIFVCPFG